jgi:hypothetical protein
LRGGGCSRPPLFDHLYETCTPDGGFGTRRVGLVSHHARMDAIAVLIAVAFTGLLLALIKLIDRI